jgi:protein disulfide-isomerase A1
MRGFGNYVLGLLGAASITIASDVHELKKDTFKAFVEEHDLVLAECKF